MIPFFYLASVCPLFLLLTQAGGGDLLGSLVQFSPAAGREGRCRQMSMCVRSTRRVLARQPAVLAPSPSAASGLGSQRFAGALPGRGVPSPSAAPARAASRVSVSL